MTLVLTAGTSVHGDQPSPASSWFDKQLPSLIETYQWLHLHPEVSFQEEETAALIAQIWRDDGFEVTTGVGGHGVVGLMRNGQGPTLMLR